MPKEQQSEKLARLAQLGALEPSAEMRTDLRAALKDKSHLVVAKAATIAADKQAHDLIPDLVDAFDRFLLNPGKTDKGCLAKLAIADALTRLDCEDAGVFLRGIHHVQMEPAWGKPIDTAANLRANCAVALVRTFYPDALFEVVTLLADKEVEARAGAVKALEYVGTRESELLLRMKALLGDAEPAILCDCFSSLMAIAPERSVGFVASFAVPPSRSQVRLGNEMGVVEGAAMALGESHLPEALKVLRDLWERDVDAEFRKTLVLPIALSRLDDAYEFLMALLEEGHRAMAVEAAKALRMFDDGGVRGAKIRQKVKARGDLPQDL